MKNCKIYFGGDLIAENVTYDHLDLTRNVQINEIGSRKTYNIRGKENIKVTIKTENKLSLMGGQN